MTGADSSVARRAARKLLPVPLRPSMPTIRMPLTGARPATAAAIRAAASTVTGHLVLSLGGASF
jgi:hypothetical protein